MKTLAFVTALAGTAFGVANAYGAPDVATEAPAARPPLLLSRSIIHLHDTTSRANEQFDRVGKTDPYTDSW